MILYCFYMICVQASRTRIQKSEQAHPTAYVHTHRGCIACPAQAAHAGPHAIKHACGPVLVSRPSSTPRVRRTGGSKIGNREHAIATPPRRRRHRPAYEISHPDRRSLWPPQIGCPSDDVFHVPSHNLGSSQHSSVRAPQLRFHLRVPDFHMILYVFYMILYSFYMFLYCFY